MNQKPSRAAWHLLRFTYFTAKEHKLKEKEIEKLLEFVYKFGEAINFLAFKASKQRSRDRR